MIPGILPAPKPMDVLEQEVRAGCPEASGTAEAPRHRGLLRPGCAGTGALRAGKRDWERRSLGWAAGKGAGAALGLLSVPSPTPNTSPAQPSPGDAEKGSLHTGKREIKSEAGVPCQEEPSSPHCSETFGIKGPFSAPFFCHPKARPFPRLTVCRH